MLKWAAIFFVISLIAGLFGFTGVATTFGAIAQILFFIFVVIFAVFLFLGLAAGQRLSRHLS
jgi:uncharacterized membrane protein YtjA (UPF0391 family)